VNWEAFWSHFKQAAAAEEKALTRLKQIFKSIDSIKDGTVNKEELAT